MLPRVFPSVRIWREWRGEQAAGEGRREREISGVLCNIRKGCQAEVFWAVKGMISLHSRHDCCATHFGIFPRGISRDHMCQLRLMGMGRAVSAVDLLRIWQGMG